MDSISIIEGSAGYASAIREFDDLEYARRGQSWNAPPLAPESPRQKQLRTAIKIYKPSFDE